MSHTLIREGDLNKDKQKPDSLAVLFVDLTGPFTTWYKIAVSQLGRGGGFLSHAVSSVVHPL